MFMSSRESCGERRENMRCLCLYYKSFQLELHLVWNYSDTASCVQCSWTGPKGTTKVRKVSRLGASQFHQPDFQALKQFSPEFKLVEMRIFTCWCLTLDVLPCHFLSVISPNLNNPTESGRNGKKQYLSLKETTTQTTLLSPRLHMGSMKLSFQHLSNWPSKHAVGFKILDSTF